MEKILKKDEISSKELIALLKERDSKNIDFYLIDVREEDEFDTTHIQGVDMLLPLSMIGEWIDDFVDKYGDKHTIFTCRSGRRSQEVCDILIDMNHNQVSNHKGGILSYKGKKV